MAVDLNPSSEEKEHPIAMYTYDADGQRIIKYLKKQLDFTVNSGNYSSANKAETFLYPSGRITAKVLDYKNERGNISSLSYTKHYYVGGKRYASKIGTLNGLGFRTSEINELITDATAANINVENLLEGEPDNGTDAFDKIEKRIERIYDAFGFTYDGDYCSGEQGTDCTELQEDFITPPYHELSNVGHVEQFYFHSDHLGSSNYITNYDGKITQHSEYLPFGELLVDEHRNSHNTRYKYNGKEFDQETGNYYYGARYYDPKTSLWLSVDPLAEKYNEWSPYNYTLNNPVKYVDPDGNGPWKPKVNDNGSTSYVMEEGDDASTLASQYGLDKNTAKKLYSTMKNGEISGKNALQITGSEVLTLDMTSDRATEQRVWDQYVYGRDRTSSLNSKDDRYSFSSKRYYKNTGYRGMLSGDAQINIKGKSVDLTYDIPLHNDATFSGSTDFQLGAFAIENDQQPATLYDNQHRIKMPLYHPDTGNRYRNYHIFTSGEDASLLYDRLSKDFPYYNYIKTKNSYLKD